MPRDLKAVGVKPKNLEARDVKPKMEGGVIAEYDRLYDVTLAAGQPMGLLLTLTYPTAGTVQSSKSP